MILTSGEPVLIAESEGRRWIDSDGVEWRPVAEMAAPIRVGNMELMVLRDEQRPGRLAQIVNSELRGWVAVLRDFVCDRIKADGLGIRCDVTRVEQFRMSMDGSFVSLAVVEARVPRIERDSFSPIRPEAFATPIWGHITGAK